jgi:hypothetical protein
MLTAQSGQPPPATHSRLPIGAKDISERPAGMGVFVAHESVVGVYTSSAVT